MRLFVSVDLPSELTSAISAVQDELRDADGLTFTDPTQAHLTLKFLGDTDEGKLPALTTALSAAVADSDVEPFEATVGGIGAFPSVDYIRVVWVGIETGARPLTRLHSAVESRTVALGFDPADHAFTPHITIARMQHAGGKSLVQRVLTDRDPTVGSMRVEDIRLTESELGPDGPEYTTRERFPLE